MFNRTNKGTFLNLVRLGHGFSKSCLKMNLDIKDASAFYESKKGEAFKKSVNRKMKSGLDLLLAEYEKVLKLEKEMFGKRELLPILQNNIDNFISVVNIWGCGLNEFQKEELEECGVIPITENMITLGVETFGNLRETATAYGLTYQELLCVVGCYPDLRKLLKHQTPSWQN